MKIVTFIVYRNKTFYQTIIQWIGLVYNILIFLTFHPIVNIKFYFVVFIMVITITFENLIVEQDWIFTPCFE